MDRRHHHYVLLFLLICLVGHSYGSRQTQVFRVMKPKDTNNAFALPPTFFGFLPKAMPIPPSGPSRNHNSIGLQSSLRKP